MMLFSKKKLTNKFVAEEISKKFAAPCFLFASARMALYQGLKLLGIGPGDEVILPAYTCVVVPNAIIYAGAKPVYVDISCEDFNIDIPLIEAKITKKTKAIYAQHTFGKMCDIAKIKALANKHNLFVIEDAALAAGAKSQGKYAGTIGDVGFISSDRSKVISSTIGGVLFVNNKEYLSAMELAYREVQEFPKKLNKKVARTFLLDFILLHPRVYFVGKPINILLRKLGFLFSLSDENFAKLETVSYPYPAKFPSTCLSVLYSQISAIDDNLRIRREKAERFNHVLHRYSQNEINQEDNIHLRYSFFVDNPKKIEESFKRYIDLGRWFDSIAQGWNPSMHDINYISGSCPKAEWAANHILNFPTHAKVDEKKLLLFCKKKVLKRFKFSIKPEI